MENKTTNFPWMELQLYMSISNSLLDVILNEGNINEQGVSQGWPQACIIKTSFKQFTVECIYLDQLFQKNYCLMEWYYLFLLILYRRAWSRRICYKSNLWIRTLWKIVKKFKLKLNGTKAGTEMPQASMAQWLKMYTSVCSIAGSSLARGMTFSHYQNCICFKNNSLGKENLF